jgi:hypothetical protein
LTQVEAEITAPASFSEHEVSANVLRSRNSGLIDNEASLFAMESELRCLKVSDWYELMDDGALVGGKDIQETPAP